MKIVGITAGADKKGAEAIMLRIKRSLEKYKIAEKGIKIRVKLGTASYPDEAITKEELLNTAEGRALGEKENAS
jgi:GGDEF domain-containing protein